MRKILFLLFLLIQSLYSIQIEKISLAYLEDNKDILKIEDIINLDFKVTASNSSLGISNNNTWYKVNILNKSNTPIQRYFHSNFAYMSKDITIYEYVNINK